MGKSKNISASLEDYLEVIYILEKKHSIARAKDIAERMNVQKSSVTGALKILASMGLVNYRPYSQITLTRQGKKIAEEVVKRHEILREFFETVLKLSFEEAEENACKIEHVIHVDAVKRLTKFLEFLKLCPRAGFDWFDAFESYCEQGLDREKCITCIEKCLKKAKSHPPPHEKTSSSSLRK